MTRNISMRSRIVLYILLFSFSLLLLMTITVHFFLNNHFRKETESKLRVVSNTVENSQLQPNTIEGQLFLNRLSHDADCKISIFDRDGIVIYDSPYTYLPAKAEGSFDEDPEVREALGIILARNEYFHIGKLANARYRMEILYKPINVNLGDSEDICYIRTCAYVEGSGTAISRVRLILFIVLLAGTVLAGVFSIWIAYRITQPLYTVMNMTKTMANTRMGTYMPVRGNDEISEIAHSFNLTSHRLDEMVEALEHQRAEIESIASGMSSGLIALDSDLNILQINPSASRMLNIDHDVTGQKLIEATSNAKLESVLKSVIGQECLTTTELPIRMNGKERTYRLYISSLNRYGQEDEGEVVLIDDITDIAQMENMRVDFVANVTHELKTPLTSIQGFVETLQSGAINDPEAASHFLDIIAMESDRLSRLINDILSISSLESGRANTVIERISVYELARYSIDFLQTNAERKNISLALRTLDQDDTYVKGDTDHLKQVLINLIENAIKYTPNGGHVRVEVEREESSVVLHVSDDGIGIPAEHIPRLFERFYRVDKGRSRATGGTGLGLAIVKHIVQDMGGTITVDSVPDEGSTFTVVFPYSEN